ncbi:hypothetical protein BGZ95_000662 [Linnemannia exigua]|uniref:Yeast cell wall synthesis Kre9/Knh1-like N-terminal domain-containing protein n=1 Tax=Linnemannia exigua TaxID=604196 RepID=A0AAD4D8C7_9FUNG|nr:hypothetical protein BGZ95_000662 [Linnemannia exigua]
MKFITSVAVAATTLAAIATAQNVPINDPNIGVTWKIGADNYVRWTGTCKALGAAAKTVKVQLMAGPSDSIHFIAELGTIDCSNATSNSALKRVPDDTTPGNDYSIQFLTDPVSYSYQFKIVNPNAAPEPQQPAKPPVEQNKPVEKTNSASGSLVAGSMIAAAGVAVAALQFIL